MPVGNYLTDLNKGVAGLRIGISRAFFANAPIKDDEVVAAIGRAAAALRQVGTLVEGVVLPDYALFYTCGCVIMLTEAFAIHERDMQTRPRDFGRLTFERFVLGATVTAADLTQAFRLRREVTTAVDTALAGYDAAFSATPGAHLRGHNQRHVGRCPHADHALQRHRTPGPQRANGPVQRGHADGAPGRGSCL